MIGFGAQDDRPHRRRNPPVKIELATDFQWGITAESAGSPLCSICRLALEKLRDSEDYVTAYVSPEVRSRAGCHLCALFIHCATRRNSAISTQERNHVCKYGFEEIDLGQATLYLEWEESGEGVNPGKVCYLSELGCLPSTNVSPGFAGPSFTGPFEKSMSLARQWIQRCEAAHPSCQNDRVTNFIPSRVIDVGERKIFHSLVKPKLRARKDVPFGSNYLTLSHCWGGTVPMRLMAGNMHSLMEHIPFDQLPKTFQDAIIVTQNLGMRYIWIDSLCIIQDDSQDWQQEAALMADVYKHSTCNLTAAEAVNSSSGLFLDHNPILTKPVKASFVTGSQGVVLHDFWPEGILQAFEASPLMTRGWVVQERILSRRNLHFSRDQVVWECRSDSTCETFPDGAPFKEIPRSLKHRFARVIYGGDQGPQSHTEVWNVLVSEYTRCKLSFASDKLIAFGGIASAFSGPLGRHYVAGMWLDNLAYQLCWVGKRRAGQSYTAPSWSWASTEGPVRSAFLPLHPSHVVRQMEVLEAHVDLVSQNSYGQLNGGYLRVAGRLTTAKITFKESEPVLLLPDAKGSYHPTYEKASLSWTKSEVLDAQRCPPADRLLYLLAVMEHVNAESEYLAALKGKPQMNPRRAPSTRWLILCPAENQAATFTRCGTLTANDSSHKLFAQACRWYDQTPGHLPVHSYGEQTGSRYSITVI
ncbi:heterokaryon incompatibility protein-domain-containing protein [Xylariaceae sp. AK1471]|nr:heterokaryon incompatibility protein-domain-containing protein [Xylariaceae sp. AK1471]